MKIIIKKLVLVIVFFHIVNILHSQYEREILYFNSTDSLYLGISLGPIFTTGNCTCQGVRVNEFYDKINFKPFYDEFILGRCDNHLYTFSSAKLYNNGTKEFHTEKRKSLKSIIEGNVITSNSVWSGRWYLDSIYVDTIENENIFIYKNEKPNTLGSWNKIFYSKQKGIIRIIKKAYNYEALSFELLNNSSVLNNLLNQSKIVNISKDWFNVLDDYTLESDFESFAPILFKVGSIPIIFKNKYYYHFKINSNIDNTNGFIRLENDKLYVTKYFDKYYWNEAQYYFFKTKKTYLFPELLLNESVIAKFNIKPNTSWEIVNPFIFSGKITFKGMKYLDNIQEKIYCFKLQNDQKENNKILSYSISKKYGFVDIEFLNEDGQIINYFNKQLLK